MKFLEKRNFGKETWVRVDLREGKEAWISGRYLDQTIARDQLIVRPANVNIRNRASRNSDKIGLVKKGDILGRVRKQDRWYLAVLPDGKKRGWIREDMVRLEALAPEKAPEEKEPAQAEPAPEQEKPAVDHRAVAQRAVDAGKTDEAIVAYRKALEKEPTNGILHFELGKILDKAGKPEQAIPHLRQAIEGRPARPEAEFTLKRILKDREAVGQALVVAGETLENANPVDGESEVGSPVLEVVAENAVYILPAAAIGSMAFIVVLAVLYRRRRIGVSSPSFRRRKADGGFDDVLKYAVEKRPVIRKIEEAEKKLSEMDAALNKRFATFKETDESGRPRLPPGESAERLIKRVDALRQTILNQEERARIYSDLVVLQNEKITALDDEIDALKKLVQLDYRDTRDASMSTAQKPDKSASAALTKPADGKS
ncbi:MAG: SH3 domain-containing protein [Candidatus Latescibacterota bacterium]|nr:SH3 domain-containing protein [Candidatus Latescibacterota bacterium]